MVYDRYTTTADTEAAVYMQTHTIYGPMVQSTQHNHKHSSPHTKNTLSFAHNPASVYKFEQIKIAIHLT